MKIGMPKEIKENEYRVAIVPHNISKLTASGHEVYVETGAGLAAGFTDEQYVQAGARILPDAASVYIQDPANLVAVNDELDGYVFYPISAQDMSVVYFKQ